MDAQEREKSMEEANQSSHYMWILVGTVISIVGVYLRFAWDSVTLSIISWVILFVGSIIACKGVFKIMNGKN
jgi:uncharacterized membrane protein HdeD (DUF308 family)